MSYSHLIVRLGTKTEPRPEFSGRPEITFLVWIRVQLHVHIFPNKLDFLNTQTKIQLVFCVSFCQFVNASCFCGKNVLEKLKWNEVKLAPCAKKQEKKQLSYVCKYSEYTKCLLFPLHCKCCRCDLIQNSVGTALFFPGKQLMITLTWVCKISVAPPLCMLANTHRNALIVAHAPQLRVWVC